MKKKGIIVNEEVQTALENNKAVVALESTIIAHGLPYPQNIETAIALEKIIWDEGACPATIGIVDGKPKVGLDLNEIEQLGKGQDIVKVSRKDLAYVVSKGLNGATTVATTMWLAKQAGISIFATGGIGGVHREANKTFDISADLTELAKTNVAVVCAGAKSILDIGLTLEYLETQGVPVIGYQTDRFPAFYVRDSGFKVNFRLDSPHEIAQLLLSQERLGLDNGLVIGNPVPPEYEMQGSEAEEAIQKAIEEAKGKKVRGKELTPFLLERIRVLTKDQSLATNVALVKNNCRLAAQIALSQEQSEVI